MRNLTSRCRLTEITIGNVQFFEGTTISTKLTYACARIDADVKERAKVVLEAMELSASDAICLLMLRIANERCLPFELKVPNAKTRVAIAELEAGKAKRFESVDALMVDLDANN